MPSSLPRCSTLGSAVNVGNNHVAVAFLTSGTMHLHATGSSAGLGERQEVGDWYVVGKIPLWRLGYFRLGKQEHQYNLSSSSNPKFMKQLGGIIRLWDPAISEAETIFYHFEILLSEDDLLVLDRITPWDRNAFRTWLGNIMWVIPGKQEGTCLSINSNELVIVRQRLWDPGIVAIYERKLFLVRLLWPIGIFQYVHVPGLVLICWCQMDVQLTEEAASFQSQSGNPLVFSSACHCWPLGSNRKEKIDRSWHLQLQEDPCRYRNLCPFFGMSWDLEYKQWDPGIGQKVFKCFLTKDQQILTARFCQVSGLLRISICRLHTASTSPSHCLGATNVSWGRLMS